ncbi:DUF3142 domain-containing protein [Sphingomonas sp. BN140010]|uniref:DUF3142 domain-containing protein n=1 Tax=Sphingomonas arvum TaxID=2992113 RepID=A0ABT3JH33_9SPHN|nr:DUF3142 domain-containing protein [Sphingomonas sp. BN140010]MCW3798259.1 DUF3142 domain-containing protein [Sphingomonas sp. BN140010]
MTRHACALAAALLLSSCNPLPADTVRAEDHEAFWLWAGVRPQPVLARAHTLYILDGEVAGEPGRYTVLRATIPRVRGPELWLTVRLETLAWQPQVRPAILRRLTDWRAAGGRVGGVQLDFDARTRHLGDYAAFLRSFRAALPPGTRLSVTGLMDWSAHGDSAQLRSLAGIVDEVAIQTYQGRSTIPGYDRYLARLGGFPIPFRIGLVQGGEWRQPAALARNPAYRGTVVFLLNPERR